MWFDGDRNEIVLSVDQEALIAEQRAICAYTGIGINIHHSHIEHMIPQAHCVQGEGDVAYDNMVACFPGPDDGYVPFGAVFKANWPPLEEQHLFVPMLAGPLPQRPLATSLLDLKVSAPPFTPNRRADEPQNPNRIPVISKGTYRSSLLSPASARRAAPNLG